MPCRKIGYLHKKIGYEMRKREEEKAKVNSKILLLLFIIIAFSRYLLSNYLPTYLDVEVQSYSVLFRGNRSKDKNYKKNF